MTEDLQNTSFRSEDRALCLVKHCKSATEMCFKIEAFHLLRGNRNSSQYRQILKRQQCTIIWLSLTTPHVDQQMINTSRHQFQMSAYYFSLLWFFFFFFCSLILVAIILPETSNILSPLLQTSCTAPHYSARLNWPCLLSLIKKFYQFSTPVDFIIKI